MNRSIPACPRRSLLAGVALAAVTLTACGGERPSTTGPAPAVDTTAVPATSVPPPDTATIQSAATTDPPSTVPASTAAPDVTSTSSAPAPPAHQRGVSLVDELVVLDQPGGSPVVTLSATTVFGTPTVVGVIATAGEWVQVLAPARPNELTGWVRATEVDVQPVDVELHVSLAERTLRLVRGGELAGEWTVAIGTAENPTPTGRFFITDKLATGEPDGVYGPWAFGLSAFSATLTDFIGGIGQIGLHGTNNPNSIGQAASHGCIRLPNDVMAALVDELPIGTPITIS